MGETTMPRALILLFAVLVLLTLAGLSAQEGAPTATATPNATATALIATITAQASAHHATTTAAAAAHHATSTAQAAQFFTNVLRYFRAGGEPISESPFNILTREELIELLTGEAARADAAQARADAAFVRAQEAAARAGAEWERQLSFTIIYHKLRGALPEDIPLPPEPPPRPTATPTPVTTAVSPTPLPTWEHLSWEELLARLSTEALRGEAESQRAEVWSAWADWETARADDLQELADAAEERLAELRATITPSPTPTPATDR